MRIGVEYSGDDEKAMPSVIYVYCRKCGKVFWWQSASALTSVSEDQYPKRLRTHDGLTKKHSKTLWVEPLDHFNHVRRITPKREPFFDTIYVEEIPKEGA